MAEMTRKTEDNDLFQRVADRLTAMAKANAVVGPTAELGDHHVIPLVELSLGLGGGGGGGEGTSPDGGGRGEGGGAGGGAKAIPVAVIVVEGDEVRLEYLGH